MPTFRIDLLKKAFRYASKTLLGTVICWYGLSLFHVENPIWAVITVVIVSDPDLVTTLGLTKARVINTLVGLFFGLGSLLLFGYSPLTCFLTAAITVMFVMLIESYPANWRLAPATVVILMDAGRLATTPHEEILYALTRMGEILVGCAVALALARFYSSHPSFLTRGPPARHDSAD